MVFDAGFVRAREIENNIEGNGFLGVVNVKAVHLGDFRALGNGGFDGVADLAMLWRVGVFGVDADSEDNTEFRKDASTNFASELVKLFGGHSVRNLNTDAANNLERAVVMEHEVIDATDVWEFGDAFFDSEGKFAIDAAANEVAPSFQEDAETGFNNENGDNAGEVTFEVGASKEVNNDTNEGAGRNGGIEEGVGAGSGEGVGVDFAGDFSVMQADGNFDRNREKHDGDRDERVIDVWRGDDFWNRAGEGAGASDGNDDADG